MTTFQNCKITVTQVTDREAVILAITENGGQYLNRLSKVNTTHLISGTRDSQKYKSAKKWGIPCVREDWIWQSLYRKKRLSLNDYLLDDERKERKIERKRFDQGKSYGTNESSLRHFSDSRIDDLDLGEHVRKRNVRTKMDRMNNELPEEKSERKLMQNDPKKSRNPRDKLPIGMLSNLQQFNSVKSSPHCPSPNSPRKITYPPFTGVARYGRISQPPSKEKDTLTQKTDASTETEHDELIDESIRMDYKNLSRNREKDFAFEQHISNGITLEDATEVSELSIEDLVEIQENDDYIEDITEISDLSEHDENSSARKYSMDWNASLKSYPTGDLATYKLVEKIREEISDSPKGNTFPYKSGRVGGHQRSENNLRSDDGTPKQQISQNYNEQKETLNHATDQKKSSPLKTVAQMDYEHLLEQRETQLKREFQQSIQQIKSSLEERFKAENIKLSDEIKQQKIEFVSQYKEWTQIHEERDILRQENNQLTRKIETMKRNLEEAFETQKNLQTIIESRQLSDNAYIQTDRNNVHDIEVQTESDGTQNVYIQTDNETETTNLTNEQVNGIAKDSSPMDNEFIKLINHPHVAKETSFQMVSPSGGSSEISQEKKFDQEELSLFDQYKSLLLETTQDNEDLKSEIQTLQNKIAHQDRDRRRRVIIAQLADICDRHLDDEDKSPKEKNLQSPLAHCFNTTNQKENETELSANEIDDPEESADTKLQAALKTLKDLRALYDNASP